MANTTVNENKMTINLSTKMTATGVYLGFNTYIKDDKRIITHYVLTGNYNNELGLFEKAEIRNVTQSQDKNNVEISYYNLMEEVVFDFEVRQFGTKQSYSCSNLRKHM